MKQIAMIEKRRNITGSVIGNKNALIPNILAGVDVVMTTTTLMK